MKERAALSVKDLRRRQLPLLSAAAHVLDVPRTDSAAHAPKLEAPPLVHRCISQQPRKNSVLAVTFEVYPKSVRVVRPVQLPHGSTRGGVRSEVQAFSEASRRRLRRVASEAGEGLTSQFCLTYHTGNPDGEKVKRDLNAWLTWLRRRVPGVSYLWVLEFQKRGAPHFHVFLSVDVGTDSTLHTHMAHKWHTITGEVDEAHLHFHMNAKNWISWDMGSGAYVCKYLDKQAQKCVPDGFGWPGRFWGASRGLMPKPVFYDAHEIRAMCGQNTHKPRMIANSGAFNDTQDVLNYVIQEHVRDATATIIRTLGNYQAAQWRRYGRKGKHLAKAKNSRWVTGGAAVLWKVVEYEYKGG